MSTPFPPPSSPSSPLHYPSSQTAVLLLDYQNAAISQVPQDQIACIAQGAAVRRWALKEGILVVHCTFDPENPCSEQYKMYDRLKSLVSMAQGNPLIVQESEQMTTDPTFHPTRPASATSSSGQELSSPRRGGVVSALSTYGSALHGFLQSRDVNSLIMAGISTSGCVLSTTKEAADMGYVCTVIGDSCGDRTVEVHEAMLGALDRGAWVVNLQELQEMWEATVKT